MKDQHYYQRLTEIRQKYGYSNEVNSYQYCKPSPTPKSGPKQPYTHTKQNLFPLKSTKSNHPDNQTSNYYNRTDNKNYNQKSLNLGIPHLQIITKNISPNKKTDLFLQSNQRLANRQKQNQVAPKTPSNRYMPQASIKWKEEASPIRQLNGMFMKSLHNDSNIIHPTEISTFSPRNISNLNSSNFQRDKIQLQNKFLNTDRIISKIGIQTQPRCQTPTQKREPFTQQNNNIKVLTNDVKNNGDKYNTNIQNIDKIQEKIQTALKKSKAPK